jgi:hypothetical protein
MEWFIESSNRPYFPQEPELVSNTERKQWYLKKHIGTPLYTFSVLLLLPPTSTENSNMEGKGKRAIQNSFSVFPHS